jgi:glycosyltransferase involved in cell wall biosynthesis
MKTSPKVTVLVPIFNGEKYLRECVESILNQTFTDFECLVINDGSTDGSAALLKSLSDHRIRYVENETNSGIANTRNKGLQLAHGQYVAFCDCDDVIVPTRWSDKWPGWTLTRKSEFPGAIWDGYWRTVNP